VVWAMDAKDRKSRGISTAYDEEVHALAARVFANRADVNPQDPRYIGVGGHAASSGTARDGSGRAAGTSEVEVVGISSSSEGEQPGTGLKVSSKRRRRSAGPSEASAKRAANSSAVGAVLTDMAASLKLINQGRQDSTNAMIDAMMRQARAQQHSSAVNQRMALVSMGWA